MNAIFKLAALGLGGLLLMAPNRRSFDHLGNFNFKVEIEGVTVGAFRAVSGLESFTEVVEFDDGSDTMVHKRPGRTMYSNFVLERGHTNNTELWNWRKAVMDGQIQRKAGSVIICDDRGDEIFRYNFFEAWPVRWKSLELDGEQSGALVETIELATEKIERG